MSVCVVYAIEHAYSHAESYTHPSSPAIARLFQSPSYQPVDWGSGPGPFDYEELAARSFLLFETLPSSRRCIAEPSVRWASNNTVTLVTLVTFKFDIDYNLRGCQHLSSRLSLRVETVGLRGGSQGGHLMDLSKLIPVVIGIYKCP